MLLQALDWKEQNDKKEKIIENVKLSRVEDNKVNSKTNKYEKGEYKKVIITNPNDDIYPPCIKIIMKGMKGDGKKRALFILINFFKSIGLSGVELEKKIYGWNDKNEQPLRKGYVQSQLSWFNRSKNMMPPNCSNNMYKDLDICKPDELCRQIKNPVNYAMKRYFRKG